MSETAEATSEVLYVGAAEAAKIAGISRSTLAQMRMRKDPNSPPWFKPGVQKVLYPVAGLRAWAEAQVTRSGAPLRAEKVTAVSSTTNGLFVPTIESGVPLPSRQRSDDPLYPFAKLEVGDSFLIPLSASDLDPPVFEDKIRAKVSSYNAHKDRRQDGRKLTLRKMDDGMRIWRSQ